MVVFPAVGSHLVFKHYRCAEDAGGWFPMSDHWGVASIALRDLLLWRGYFPESERDAMKRLLSTMRVKPGVRIDSIPGEQGNLL